MKQKDNDPKIQVQTEKGSHNLVMTKAYKPDEWIKVIFRAHTSIEDKKTFVLDFKMRHKGFQIKHLGSFEEYVGNTNDVKEIFSGLEKILNNFKKSLEK